MRRLRKKWVVGGSALLAASFTSLPYVQGNQTTALRFSITTDKARYNPGDPVKIVVTVTNTSDSTVTGALDLTFTHLNNEVGSQPPRFVTISEKSSESIYMTWNPPMTDFQGYQINGTFLSPSGSELGDSSTAVDVSSDWTKFPRYGFVSEYPQMSASEITGELKQLKDYHIDGLQFYDWQWKHEVPLAGTVSTPAQSWQDIAGRTNVRQTIIGLINTGHQLGMKSFNYNLLYGAWDGYEKDGVKPQWGLYSDKGGHLPVSVGMPGGWSTSAIDLLNPENPEWRLFIFGQEAKVFKAYPFDGWQVDQLGDQGAVYDYKGNPVDLGGTFAPFLNAATKALGKQMIFNDVGGYGLQDVAGKSNESVAYVECWPNSGQALYSDLKTTIDSVYMFSKGKKSTVLAAYLDSDYANSFAGKQPGQFNEPGVLLTDATIFASGGNHIELGDDLQMLNAPYFPNHNLAMSSTLKTKLLSYYDFMVAYENLLRGGLANTRSSVSIKGISTSRDGSVNTVWTFPKASGHYQVLQMINLYHEKNILWQDSRADQPTPPTLHNLLTKYYVGNARVHEVYVASPDNENGKSQQLAFTRGHDSTGNYIQFSVPRLQYWDMVYMLTSTIVH